MFPREKTRDLAEAHVASLELRGHRYKFAGIAVNELRPNEWAAIFDVYAPDCNLMDGPIVLILDRVTGIVRDLHEAMRNS